VADPRRHPGDQRDPPAAAPVLHVRDRTESPPDGRLRRRQAHCIRLLGDHRPRHREHRYARDPRPAPTTRPRAWPANHRRTSGSARYSESCTRGSAEFLSKLHAHEAKDPQANPDAW